MRVARAEDDVPVAQDIEKGAQFKELIHIEENMYLSQSSQQVHTEEKQRPRSAAARPVLRSRFPLKMQHRSPL